MERQVLVVTPTKTRENSLKFIFHQNRGHCKCTPLQHNYLPGTLGPPGQAGLLGGNENPGQTNGAAQPRKSGDQGSSGTWCSLWTSQKGVNSPATPAAMEPDPSSPQDPRCHQETSMLSAQCSLCPASIQCVHMCLPDYCLVVLLSVCFPDLYS